MSSINANNANAKIPMGPKRFKVIHRQSGRKFNLNAELVIGRSKGQIRFAEDKGISSRHLRIGLDARGIWIQDLGSTNGTFFQDQRLEPARKYHLKPGDDIQLGEQSFYVIEDPSRNEIN
ncbi:MAG: hypothetical protein C5B49_06650, partial [Bdellovibrio sp.]